MQAVCNRICVHIALDPKIESMLYDLPHMDEPWTVCLECAEELDRRLWDWQTRDTTRRNRKTQ
jgi:hypothetical protein